MAEEKMAEETQNEQTASTESTSTNQNPQAFLDSFDWDKYQEGIIEYRELLAWDDVIRRLRKMGFHVTYNFIIPRVQLN